ncbi:uncharacterized protein CIMG_13547 [Coccidioides immitis RS]|uniref:Uncharacterized protein n=3 Tax=Coccidioides immitis TaxID=5501 RepID=J3K0V6_COCIM|nr:uncharacterized protein CIMG_13547 [Coccidioides immitis RS]EAS27522.3 hypothetical protein CIMG_13547 [Coccidioides immitis RS]KMP09482.1 hypothetical protein CIRG_09652 [Coccidioides immitis RMSCC 2394]KMU78474.1 hypothetical protein CISG_07478 [Coccidioides immitis RMSCC 3703]
MNTVIKNTYEVSVVTFAQAINKKLKTVFANMPKETSSVNNKPDTLNGEVIKALQEIFLILKEIQEIQEINFVTVSDIKNTLYLKCSFNEQQNMASKSVSSSHDMTPTQIIISAKPSMPVVKNPNANKKNAEKNNVNNKNVNKNNANKNNADKNDADKDVNNKNANKKGAESKNAEKADTNVTSNVSSKDFQNWFFSQGDL